MRLRLKGYLFLFFLISLYVKTNGCYAQNPDSKRTWHWYFGYNAGLDFSSGVAVPDTTGHLNTFEGCAAISDTAGNLLFYTDGDTVWDRLHNPMPNGTGLLGCGNYGSSAQAAIIIPHPGNQNLYYIITNDCNENSCFNGLRYSLVDIILNSGLGDVTIKNSLLFSPGTETLAVTKQCNTNFYWIISHEFGNNNFRIYSLDSSGLNTPPFITSIGADYTYHTNMLRFSSDGSKLAAAITSPLITSELFDFDNASGIISNKIQLNGNWGAWGPEFSFDNSKLYFTSGGNIIYQYDLISGVDSIINSSLNIVANGIDNTVFGTLAKGPDKKIYVSSLLRDSISTIDSSNVYGIGCNVNQLNFYLLKNSFYGLPNFIADYFSDTTNNPCTTGINEASNDLLQVFPNPAHNELELKGISISKIEIFDVLGNLCLSANVIKPLPIKLDVSKLSRGIYLLKLKSGKQIIIRKVMLI